MGISISPDSWLLNLFKNSKERDLKIADYLDQIVEEATNLAKIWENVVRSVQTTGVANAESNTIWIRLVERPEWTIYSKNIPRSRLEIFYDRVSSVLSKNNRGEMDYFICKIGTILQKRKLTKDSVEEDLRRIKDVRYFDKTNHVNGEISLTESINLMNKEVAALSLFAKEFRTKI
jgi:hypothetical protein